MEESALNFYVKLMLIQEEGKAASRLEDFPSTL
jgi:hypothetical protein